MWLALYKKLKTSASTFLKSGTDCDAYEMTEAAIFKMKTKKMELFSEDKGGRNGMALADP